MDRPHINQRVVSRDLIEISATYECLFHFLLSARASLEIAFTLPVSAGLTCAGYACALNDNHRFVSETEEKRQPAALETLNFLIPYFGIT
jgi:hypothetical protein